MYVSLLEFYVVPQTEPRIATEFKELKRLGFIMYLIYYNFVISHFSNTKKTPYGAYKSIRYFLRNHSYAAGNNTSIS